MARAKATFSHLPSIGIRSVSETIILTTIVAFRTRPASSDPYRVSAFGEMFKAESHAFELAQATVSMEGRPSALAAHIPMRSVVAGDDDEEDQRVFQQLRGSRRLRFVRGFF